MPAAFQLRGVSQIALAKGRPVDELNVQVRFTNGSGQASCSAGRSDGLLLVLDGGFSVSYIPSATIRELTQNSLIVIAPYWFEGTWVFDDDQLGLHREPFVAGVPEMINQLVKDIPDAKQGFRLTCSETAFPGYQKKLTWVRAENGGNYYRLDKPELEGWLCPAMFQYFSHTPKVLYVRADPKGP
jgi:hypothetical protein